MKKIIFTALVCLSTGTLLVAQTPAQNDKEHTPAVLICGTGDAPYYENIVDDLLDSLADHGVSAKICEEHPLSRSTSVEKAKEVGAGSVLYVSLHVSERIAYETTLSVQCVSADGKKLWEEHQGGPLMTPSIHSTINIITNKMKKKLEAHVGKPGLPTSK